MNSVNFIGRAYFQGEEHVDNVWKMRISLLTGFTLITGAFAGSLVSVILLIYLIGRITNYVSQVCFSFQQDLLQWYHSKLLDSIKVKYGN